MTPQMVLILVILLIAIVLFLTEKFRPDIIAISVMLTLVLSGILTYEKAFIAGFANPAVITVGAVLVISKGLFQTGIADFLGARILRFAGNNESRLLVGIMLTVGAMSAFMNNIGATAVLLPAVLTIAKKTKISASKLLIPLSFASLMGGDMTLIGTPPNILASAALHEHTGQGFGFFDFAPMGILILGSGVLYMVFIGRHILPDRGDDELADSYRVQDYLSEIRILKNSSLIGKTPIESRFGADYDLAIIGIIQEGKHSVQNIHRDARIHVGDTLLVKGSLDKIVKAKEAEKLQIITSSDVSEEDKELAFQDMAIAEVVLDVGSTIFGSTLQENRFREKHRLTVLALRRRDHLIKGAIKNEPLQYGDVLLVQGRKENLALLRTEPDFLVLDSLPFETRRHHKAKTALIILSVLLLTVTAGFLHISVAALTASVLMVIFGVLTMEEVYQAVDWRAIFFIAGMLTLGAAMEVTHTAKFIADLMVVGLIDYGPTPILIGLYILTAILTQLMSNSASTVLLAPIAINIAQVMEADPRPFLMIVVIAASTIFLSPIGHAANILVFGPGRYKFLDYTKVGFGLMLIHITLTIMILPLVWPLFPNN
ncbi:SLC13 family permease [Anaerolineales bacterium HSG24]|nr:SLC13 family permease [Anaerolineales bacterium HSG24]